MKNFLIALGLLVLIIFVKNLYEDNQFSKGEIEILNSELLIKETTINKLQKEKNFLIKKLKIERSKNRIPKKIKLKVRPIEIVPEITPEVIPQQTDTLTNF